jgi:hypothetical protein
MFLRNIGYLPTSPHSVTTQKTNLDIFTAMRTSISNFHSCPCKIVTRTKEIKWYQEKVTVVQILIRKTGEIQKIFLSATILRSQGLASHLLTSLTQPTNVVIWSRYTFSTPNYSREMTSRWKKRLQDLSFWYKTTFKLATATKPVDPSVVPFRGNAFGMTRLGYL